MSTKVTPLRNPYGRDPRGTVKDARSGGRVEGERARPAAYADDTLALDFAAAYEARLRFVAGWGRWMVWKDHRWVPDVTQLARELAKPICRVAAQQALVQEHPKSRDKLAHLLLSSKTIVAVERLAQTDRRLAATTDQWDQDRWLLNTPGGMVDLRTGETQPHDRGAYCTKSTAVGPAPPEAVPTRWLAFLDRITAGNVELQGFLQRVAGYALTGDVSAHALLFAYGTGANGKSVFINTLSGVLGDYATSTPIETFMASQSDRHPTELADLRGARLVTAAETEEGRRWAESRIKAMTGGDPIKARFMRQDFFEFQPQFKLLLSGNHKPGLRGVDEAIRRRLHLIPFTVTIPEAERDPDLPQKLRDEWAAILRWAIDGCLSWQEVGLAPPDIVRSATSSYLAEEDAVALWLDECCVPLTDAWESSTDLFASWKAWAERSGEFASDQKRFVNTLETRGFEPKRQPGTGRRGFRGVRIIRQAATGDGWDS